MDAALEEFYSNEAIISGCDRDRLSCPGGPPDAELGVILHVETKDIEFGNFYDPDNETMKLLRTKGVRHELNFGFDWHWRGETTQDWLTRRKYPFPKWKKQLRDFHNDFSWQLMEIIPMPFLVTGAACAREGIRQRLPLAKRLRVNDVLEFDLDFRAGVLRRIILHLAHPVAGFYTNEKTK